MNYWLIGILIKPFVGLLLLGGVALPIRWLIHHKMPECKLKTMLLKHRSGKKDSFCR